jgi:hypothetical protein
MHVVNIWDFLYNCVSVYLAVFLVISVLYFDVCILVYVLCILVCILVYIHYISSFIFLIL